MAPRGFDGRCRQIRLSIDVVSMGRERYDFVSQSYLMKGWVEGFVFKPSVNLFLRYSGTRHRWLFYAFNHKWCSMGGLRVSFRGKLHFALFDIGSYYPVLRPSMLNMHAYAYRMLGMKKTQSQFNYNTVTWWTLSMHQATAMVLQPGMVFTRSTVLRYWSICYLSAAITTGKILAVSSCQTFIVERAEGDKNSKNACPERFSSEENPSKETNPSSWPNKQKSIQRVIGPASLHHQA